MMRLLVGLLALFVVEAAGAQTLTTRPVSQDPVTQADMTERLEKSAIQTAKSAPKGAARGSSIDFCWASTPDEYRALAKHVLVLVSVVTQDSAELPLRRVYVTVDGKETELTRLSSQLSGVLKGSKDFFGARASSRGRILSCAGRPHDGRGLFAGRLRRAPQRLQSLQTAGRAAGLHQRPTATRCLRRTRSPTRRR